MTRRLDGHVIVVTGSTSGLGRTMVQVFASEGASVAITGRSAGRGRAVEQEIGASGGDALFIPMDIADEDDVRTAIDTAEHTFGRVTGLVNNAAWVQDRDGLDGPLSEIETENWERLLRVDLTGMFLASKYGLRAIARSGGGSVVNISSAAGVRGQLGGHAYAAAKGAIQALTRSMAVYYSRYHIRVNCLGVGTIDTGEGRLKAILDDPVTGPGLRQHYLGRAGTPLEVAHAAAFLLSAEAGFVNGALLPVDNGATIRSHTFGTIVDMRDVPPPADPWI